MSVRQYFVTTGYKSRQVCVCVYSLPGPPRLEEQGVIRSSWLCDTNQMRPIPLPLPAVLSALGLQLWNSPGDQLSRIEHTTVQVLHIPSIEYTTVQVLHLPSVVYTTVQVQHIPSIEHTVQVLNHSIPV